MSDHNGSAIDFLVHFFDYRFYEIPYSIASRTDKFVSDNLTGEERTLGEMCVLVLESIQSAAQTLSDARIPEEDIFKILLSPFRAKLAEQKGEKSCQA